jgi:hypothetical protein
LAGLRVALLPELARDGLCAAADALILRNNFAVNANALNRARGVTAVACLGTLGPGGVAVDRPGTPGEREAILLESTELRQRRVHPWAKFILHELRWERRAEALHLSRAVATLAAGL